jgi:hypothetical protein
MGPSKLFDTTLLHAHVEQVHVCSLRDLPRQLARGSMQCADAKHRARENRRKGVAIQMDETNWHRTTAKRR